MKKISNPTGPSPKRESSGKNRGGGVDSESVGDFGPARLGNDLLAAGVRLSESARSRLWRFHEILRERNEELNLTRLHSYDTMVRKHYVDCLLVPEILKKRQIPLSGPIMDLGTGGGFPGIPLAIATPELDWYLVEGRENRCRYLVEVVESLQITNATVFWRKLQPQDALPVSAMISRAVESMASSARRLGGSLLEGGLLIFMKGPNCDDEIREMGALPCELLLDEHYTLPASQDRRRLVVYRRTDAPHRGRRLYPYGRMSDRLSGALEIRSFDNPKFKSLKKILSGARGIYKEGCTLIYGRRVVQEVLDRSPEHVEAIILDERSRDAIHGGAMDLPSGGEIWILSRELHESLKLGGFDPPYLLFRVSEIPPWNPEEEDRSCLILPLGDPENLGLSLRSALAFGIRRAVLLEEAASPYLPATIRSSSGASLRFEYFAGPSLRALPDHLPGIPVIALDKKGEPLSAVSSRSGPVALLVGEEGGGLPQNFYKKSGVRVVGIPIDSEVDSLNAAVSVSIALYHLFPLQKETEQL